MRRFVDNTGVEFVLLEEGGPYVPVGPWYRPAVSGNPAEWMPVDRAKLVLGRGEDATFGELRKALSDLVIWVENEGEKGTG